MVVADSQDGYADVTYLPTEPGEYLVHVLHQDQEIRNSPFYANIKPYDPTVKSEKVS